MRTVRLDIAFQGTHYAGWQSQRNGKTVQERLEAALHRILNEKTNLHGSSRTDSGVHAKGYVAHFKTKNPLKDSTLVDALNHYLPGDIVVLKAKTVSDSFHARFSAKSKTYEYLVWNHGVRPAYDLAPFALWVPQRLDIAAMRKAAKPLIGQHDFNAFRASGEEERRTVKRIKSLSVTKKGHVISIRVTADGFLKHMVRILAGTLVDVGRGKLPIRDIKSILASKDRKKSGPTAKPHGLVLLKVRY